MKTYLVTGVSRGIGKATAETLLKRGHFVYGTYNSNKESAESLKKLSDNVKVKTFQVDLTEYKNIDQLVEQLKNVKFDGIVNSAGIFEEVEFENFDIVAFEKNFRVNAYAPFYLVNKLRNNLNDGSAIVNISSTDAMVGSYVGLSYSASKAALINLTQSLANQLAHRKIRANAVAPGWIGDGMRAPQELLKLAADYNPLKRTGTYEDMANLICFLLSDEAAYVNGTTVVADGGDMAKNYILEKESELV